MTKGSEDLRLSLSLDSETLKSHKNRPEDVKSLKAFEDYNFLKLSKSGLNPKSSNNSFKQSF